MENQNLIKRGSIFYYDLGATDGSVQSGTRPVMIVQNDKGNFYSPTLIVVPITSVPKKFYMPTHVYIGKQFGLTEESMLLAEQLTTISKDSLREFIGVATKDFMRQVDRALAISIGLTRKSRRKTFEACLCPTCLNNFFETHNYIIRRIDKFQTEKDTCTYCQQHRGYDYRIIDRKERNTDDRST